MNNVITHSLKYFCYITFEYLYHFYQCGPQECGFYPNFNFLQELKKKLKMILKVQTKTPYHLTWSKMFL